MEKFILDTLKKISKIEIKIKIKETYLYNFLIKILILITPTGRPLLFFFLKVLSCLVLI